MRPIWSGTISFGLIHIPVKLYSASISRQLNFHYLREEDQCPIKYVRVCRHTGEEVSYEKLVKGYEYQKGDYVVMTDDDFRKANVKKSRTIEVSEFVDIGEVDKRAFDKPYYLEPTKEAQKAYLLLRDALSSSGKAGIARFVLRSKEYLAAIMPMDKALVMETLRFADEIRDASGLDISDETDYSDKEINIAIQLIDQLTEKFDFAKYRDAYTEELKAVIQEKLAGKEPSPKGEETVFRADVTDIMAKLKESLEDAKKKK
jgi:DNA end-binding protein Ku